MGRSVGLPRLIFAQPRANSPSVEHEALDTIRRLADDVPHGVGYKIIYDPTVFIGRSVHDVVVTIVIAIALVVAVVWLFLRGPGDAEFLRHPVGGQDADAADHPRAEIRLDALEPGGRAGLAPEATQVRPEDCWMTSVRKRFDMTPSQAAVPIGLKLALGSTRRPGQG